MFIDFFFLFLFLFFQFRLNEEVVQKILEKHNKSTEQRKQMKNKLKVWIMLCGFFSFTLI